MGKTLRIVLAVVLLCHAASREGWSAVTDLDREIAAQEKARDELDKKIQQYNETAKIKAQQAQSLLGRITDLRQNSKMAQQQIKLHELQGKKLQKAITELTWEMSELSRQVDNMVADLRSRVINMYKFGSREELNLLLSAENTHDAVSSAYLLSRLVRHDRSVLEDLMNKLARVERAKSDLEKNSAQLAKQIEDLNAQNEKYNSFLEEASATLSSVQRERRKAAAAAKEVEQAQQEIGRTILALARKKNERQVTVESSVTSKDSLTGDYPSLARGSMLDWPVKGSIVNPYGSRVHPVFKTKYFNSGIDIVVAAGTPVKAAGPGEVLFEGWLRGFGQVVIIDHGRNISTVYANLASTRVKVRDAVRPGTIIGTVGNTGAMEEYNLHFEVRVGDAPKNPLDYLKKT